ncbi:MAG: hypothetical protein HYR90_02845 [Candidatus Andersenbacteria bacterium]|nr:hypothetical protein [Candidatus Andersenbacteria bacterium]MBI3251095.1 hypothetical protein [Candidatus Andersenbacteria bacterium]
MDRITEIASIAQKAGAWLAEMFTRNESSSAADIASQQIIVPELQKYFPTIPILAEERMEGASLLPSSDDTKDLPFTYWSVDPLDGSAVFDNKCSEWAVSIALIENHRPTLGVLHFPRFEITVQAEEGKGCWLNGKQIHVSAKRPLSEWLIGVDLCRSVEDEFVVDTLLPLIRKFRYVRNFPTVASNLELLLGHTGLWITNNVRNWDLAAAAIAVQEAGGVVQQLDGQPINWKSVRMPPIISVADKSLLAEIPS